ncbi:unnamed protein product [Mucor hiemalis]
MDVRYRVKWENFTIIVDNVDDEEYKSLVRLGSALGICVLKKWSKSVTHVYVSEASQKDVGEGVLKGLEFNKHFITKKWIEAALFDDLKQDRKVPVKSFDDEIETIVWKDVGPCKLTASLCYDERRSTLFADSEFIILDKAQLKRLCPHIEACGGTWKYVDLDLGESVDFNHKSLLLVPTEKNPSETNSVEDRDPSSVEFESVDKNIWKSIFARYLDETGHMRVIWEIEIGWAIVYCTTNYTCNPASSMSSVLLSMDADKKEHPSCSVNATVPYSLQYNSEDEVTMPYNTDGATMPYNTDQATVPYNADEEEDEKAERNNQCNFSTRHQKRESSPAGRETATREATPISEIASVYDTAPVNETASSNEAAPTHETTRTPQATANNYITNDGSSPVREMSPISALSPGHDAQVSSPLLSVSPEPDVSNYSASMDYSASLADPMTDLNDFFSDFVGTMKAKPPPKRASAYSSPIVEEPTPMTEELSHVDKEPTPITEETSHVPEEPTHVAEEPSNEAEPRQIKSSPARSDSLEPNFREDVLAIRNSPSPAASTPVSGKRMIVNTNNPQPTKRKKVITREEELMEEEAEEAKSEPTTPPALSATEPPSMETLREEQVGTYATVVYAPLVVRSRPPRTNDNAQSRTNKINFKTFKKVKQFEYEDEMDIVHMFSNSQRFRDTQIQQQRRTRETGGARIEETENFDPDLFIRSARRV